MASSSFARPAPLAERLFTVAPRPENVTADELLDCFLDYAREKKLALYPAQEEALLELLAGKNVIVATPTGSGKSLVATAAHFRARALGERSFYTCPIKALVNEKFFALCREFGPNDVGLMTGDATVNHDAPIICCTAEILASIALREGSRADLGTVIMDEFHYYADRDRGTAWQLPLLTLPQATFVLMSATMGPTEFFEKKLTELNGRPTAVVRATERPVPLEFSYSELALHEALAKLVRAGRAPIYVVCFTQRACAEEAQNLMSTDYSSKDEKKAIAQELAGYRFGSPYGKEIQKFLRHGIGLHHAGLLPKYRLLVEKLAQKGLLKVICGTDTLGVGVNVPIRTVVFTRLCKYDGEKTSILTVRDFQQISGRAGRKGFDDLGTVVVQAPEHVIENLRLEAKAGDDPAKKRKIVKKKPPTKGYVHWDKSTFDRLVTAPAEPLVPRFQVTHGMMLGVLERGSGGCRAMARLVRDCHLREAEKRGVGRVALAIYRSLVDAGIIERSPEDGRLLVNLDLQEDFSVHHALGLYLLDTIERLDRESPTYALDVLTLVESILEDPDVILGRQLDKIKTEKMAELKAAGVEFDDRIAELEKLEYPKPNREFIYDTFNAFAKTRPWIGQENIRPKSIAREMYETFQSFAEYVKEYGIERAEGVLLRYLSDVYKTLVQTVPLPAKTPELDEITVYFRAMVRAADSSLLDEWERMRGQPGFENEFASEPRAEGAAAAGTATDVTTDVKAFTVLVRNAAFAFVRAIARRDYAGASELLEPAAEPWTAHRIGVALEPFWHEHTSVRIDADARGPHRLRVVPAEVSWSVEQVIVDAEDSNDWRALFRVDLALSRERGEPVMELLELGA